MEIYTYVQTIFIVFIKLYKFNKSYIAFYFIKKYNITCERVSSIVVLETIHVTLSLHGGVVRLPLYV